MNKKTIVIENDKITIPIKNNKLMIRSDDDSSFDDIKSSLYNEDK